MKKLSISILTTLIFLGGLLSSSIKANGIINTNTTEGNHLFTAKFEGNGKFCTAVAINPTTYLTASHCVDYKSQEGRNIGKLYPALSGISTPLNAVNVSKVEVYAEANPSGQVSQAKDIAILKVTEPLPTSLEHYLNGRKPNIQGVNKDRTENGQNSLVGKSVYAIGYSSERGNNYSTKFDGVISNLYIDGANGNDESSYNKSGLITTNIYAAGGQSGSGLFLKDEDGNNQNDELLGILSTSNNNNENATFALITPKVKEWIEKNSN